MKKIKPLLLAMMVCGLAKPAFAQQEELSADQDWIDDAKTFITQQLEQGQDGEGESLLHQAQWGPPRRVWTCFARSSRSGRVFSGQSSNASTARRIAMNRCVSSSNSCHLRNCR